MFTVGLLGTVSLISFVEELPQASFTVTVTVVLEGCARVEPAVGFCVISKAARSVQMSEEMARTSLVRSGTVNWQLVEVSVRSRLVLPMVGLVSSFTVKVLVTGLDSQPLLSATLRVTL